MNKRYMVSQQVYVWAESPEQAASIVRQGQRSDIDIIDYRTFEVNETRDDGRGYFKRVNGTMRTIEVDQ